MIRFSVEADDIPVDIWQFWIIVFIVVTLTWRYSYIMQIDHMQAFLSLDILNI